MIPTVSRRVLIIVCAGYALKKVAAGALIASLLYGFWYGVQRWADSLPPAPGENSIMVATDADYHN